MVCHPEAALSSSSLLSSLVIIVAVKLVLVVMVLLVRLAVFPMASLYRLKCSLERDNTDLEDSPRYTSCITSCSFCLSTPSWYS